MLKATKSFERFDYLSVLLCSLHKFLLNLVRHLSLPDINSFYNFLITLALEV